jgi:flagellar biogenesis protein FliO
MMAFFQAVRHLASRQTFFRRTEKRLKLAETISLGPKGFIALVQLDGQEMLVGGAGSSISVLAKRAARKSPKVTAKTAWRLEAAEER